MTLALAARSAGRSLTSAGDAHLVLRFAGLFAAILLGVVIVVLVRRKVLLARDEKEPSYTLAELKEMHETGRIDDEEYKRLKKLVSERLEREALGDAGDERRGPEPPRAADPEADE